MPTHELTGLALKINGDFSTDPSRTRVILDERTAGGIKNTANLIVDLIDEALAVDPNSFSVQAVEPMVPYQDPRIMALQRRSFKTELLEALRRTAEGRFEDLRYSPGWLNPADFEELARSVGLRTVPQQLENVQGLYAFLRFMGAREATMEDLATGLEISTPSSLGAAEVVSQITKLHPTKQIGTSEIDSHWRLWPVDGRSVPLNESAAAALRSHKARQNQERIAAREWHDGELVFPNRLGKPMDPTNLYSQEYKPLLKRAGLAEQGFTFHALRHTFATALFSRDVHPKKVQSLLGHSSITQTMDTYSHLIGDIGGDAIAGLDEAFGYS